KRQKIMPDMDDVNEALNGDETGEADDLLFGYLQGVITIIILSALAAGSGLQEALKLVQLQIWNCTDGLLPEHLKRFATTLAETLANITTRTAECVQLDRLHQRLVAIDAIRDQTPAMERLHIDVMCLQSAMSEH